MSYPHQYAIITRTFTCVFPHLEANGLQCYLDGREGSLSQLFTFQCLSLVPHSHSSSFCLPVL